MDPIQQYYSSHPPCTAVLEQYYSSSTYSTRPTDPPTHPATMCSSTAARTAIREYVHAQFIAVSNVGFHVFTISPPYRGPGTAPFDALRSPSWASVPVLSPGSPRATVWGGLGAAARPRGARWRSGAAGLRRGILRQA